MYSLPEFYISQRREAKHKIDIYAGIAVEAISAILSDRETFAAAVL